MTMPQLRSTLKLRCVRRMQPRVSGVPRRLSVTVVAESDFEKRFAVPADTDTDGKQSELKDLPGSPDTSYTNANYKFKPAANSSYTTEDYTAPSGPTGGGGVTGGGGGSGGGGGGSDGEHNDGEPGDYQIARMATIFLAFLMFVGGGMGYAKKGSTKSAIAGGVIGVALLLSGCFMGDPSFAVASVKAALAVCVLTAIAMAVRVNKTAALKDDGKPTPAAVVLGITSLYAIGYITVFKSVLL